MRTFFGEVAIGPSGPAIALHGWVASTLKPPLALHPAQALQRRFAGLQFIPTSESAALPATAPFIQRHRGTLLMKRHWADKPLLRDFFWFLVLPYRYKQWLEEQKRHDGDSQT